MNLVLSSVGKKGLHHQWLNVYVSLIDDNLLNVVKLLHVNDNVWLKSYIKSHDDVHFLLDNMNSYYWNYHYHYCLLQ